MEGGGKATTGDKIFGVVIILILILIGITAMVGSQSPKDATMTNAVIGGSTIAGLVVTGAYFFFKK